MSNFFKLVLTHVLYQFLCLICILDVKWLDSKLFVFLPSESPIYHYMYLKFLILIVTTYFVHMMITKGGAVQFSKTVVTLVGGNQKAYNSQIDWKALNWFDYSQNSAKWRNKIIHLLLKGHYFIITLYDQ